MKTSAEVRAELADLERQRRGNEEAVAVADRGIAEESVRAFRKVDGADKRRKEHHAARTAALEQLEHIALVEATLQLELEEAEQAETRAGREASAGEAEKFAEGLPTIFKECDRHLANFHAAYTACIDAVRTARAKKWNVPSEEMVMSKTVRAIKTAFSGAQLRGLDWSPVSPVEQTSFQAIGEAYARGLVGGAVHLRNDPPPPKPAPPLPPAPANQSETRPYRRADLSRPLPGDAALGGFRIYNDVNERNLAIEQAQRGGRS